MSLEENKKTALEEIKEIQDLDSLDVIYRKYLGRKGELTKVLRSLKDLSEEEKKDKGKQANQIKKTIENALDEKKKELKDKSHKSEKQDWVDVTAPGRKINKGSLHPLTTLNREIGDIFKSMGFSVVDGPEAETEHYNFDALNIPKNHPARDLWDTFWLKNVNFLLRTHTSPVQIRHMEKHNPPLRIIAPGKVFRHEATDASHDVQFYQIEGLMVDKDISVANFKAVIENFFKTFFSSETKVRLRPSYFPFTEPSFEVDVKREGEDWLEIMGAGMVHPNVLKAVGYTSKEWQGFAFGVGLDRLAMIRYQIDDIRLFHSGDLRFLKQF